MHAEPYSLERDGDFVFEVYACTRADEVCGWGFDEAQALQFLRMQHRMQLASYASQFPGAERSVLWAGGERVGYVCVDREPHELHIVDIALLPRFRARGLGSALIRDLQTEASERGLPLTLTVRSDSRARGLYERLGFEVVSEHAPYLKMAWTPASLAAVRQLRCKDSGDNDV